MTPRTGIKVCGVTSPETADWLAGQDIDLVGVNLVPGSARRVDWEAAAAIAGALAGRVLRVAVVARPDAALLERVLAGEDFDLVQFHGDEDAGQVRAAGSRALRACPLGGGPARDRWRETPRAWGLLVEPRSPNEGFGGVGRAWHYERAAHWAGATDGRWLLAGGLRPENVARALRAVSPWGVDVASGVESAPGVTDPARVAAFVREVRRADQQRFSQTQAGGGRDAGAAARGRGLREPGRGASG